MTSLVNNNNIRELLQQQYYCYPLSTGFNCFFILTVIFFYNKKERERDKTIIILFREEMDIAEALLKIEMQTNDEIKKLNFKKPSVSVVYYPLDYAGNVHQDFTARYCTGTKKILFLGMNPGPFGMVQTGVPFGEIEMVKDWLKITGDVERPAIEHPLRKIEGFECKRSEVSGKRFWGVFKDICVVPDNFFRNAFVCNYCPAAFVNDRGVNVTPNDLKAKKKISEQKSLSLSFFCFLYFNIIY